MTRIWGAWRMSSEGCADCMAAWDMGRVIVDEVGGGGGGVGESMQGAL